MTNGSNDWGVGYSLISFVDRVITTHANVSDVERHHDLCFEIQRIKGENIRLVCINEYTCSLARVLEVLDIFPRTNIVFVGGEWNGYTWQAKEYCLGNKMGLFNSKEINGALHRKDYWNYHRKDDEGNPVYPSGG